MNFPVERDDIVILSSDGMGDNLWEEDVLEEVMAFRERSGDGGAVGFPQQLSEALAKRARKASEGGTGSAEVPFGRKAKADGIKWIGGKTDGEFDFVLFRFVGIIFRV